MWEILSSLLEIVFVAIIGLYAWRYAKEQMEEGGTNATCTQPSSNGQTSPQKPLTGPLPSRDVTDADIDGFFNSLPSIFDDPLCDGTVVEDDTQECLRRFNELCGDALKARDEDTEARETGHENVQKLDYALRGALRFWSSLRSNDILEDVVIEDSTFRLESLVMVMLMYFKRHPWRFPFVSLIVQEIKIILEVYDEFQNSVFLNRFLQGMLQHISISSNTESVSQNNNVDAKAIEPRSAQNDSSILAEILSTSMKFVIEELHVLPNEETLDICLKCYKTAGKTYDEVLTDLMPTMGFLLNTTNDADSSSRESTPREKDLVVLKVNSGGSKRTPFCANNLKKTQYLRSAAEMLLESALSNRNLNEALTYVRSLRELGGIQNPKLVERLIEEALANGSVNTLLPELISENSTDQDPLLSRRPSLVPRSESKTTGSLLSTPNSGTDVSASPAATNPSPGSESTSLTTSTSPETDRVPDTPTTQDGSSVLKKSPTSVSSVGKDSIGTPNIASSGSIATLKTGSSTATPSTNQTDSLATPNRNQSESIGTPNSTSLIETPTTVSSMSLLETPDTRRSATAKKTQTTKAETPKTSTEVERCGEKKEPTAEKKGAFLGALPTAMLLPTDLLDRVMDRLVRESYTKTALARHATLNLIARRIGAVSDGAESNETPEAAEETPSVSESVKDNSFFSKGGYINLVQMIFPNAAILRDYATRHGQIETVENFANYCKEELPDSHILSSFITEDTKADVQTPKVTEGNEKSRETKPSNETKESDEANGFAGKQYSRMEVIKPIHNLVKLSLFESGTLFSSSRQRSDLVMKLVEIRDLILGERNYTKAVELIEKLTLGIPIPIVWNVVLKMLCTDSVDLSPAEEWLTICKKKEIADIKTYNTFIRACLNYNIPSKRTIGFVPPPQNTSPPQNPGMANSMGMSHTLGHHDPNMRGYNNSPVLSGMQNIPHSGYCTNSSISPYGPNPNGPNALNAPGAPYGLNPAPYSGSTSNRNPVLATEQHIHLQLMENLSQSLDILSEMVENGKVLPTIETYNEFLSVVPEENVWSLLKEMKERKIIPTYTTAKLLLQRITRGTLPELVVKVLKMVETIPGDMSEDVGVLFLRASVSLNRPALLSKHLKIAEQAMQSFTRKTSINLQVYTLLIKGYENLRDFEKIRSCWRDISQKRRAKRRDFEKILPHIVEAFLLGEKYELAWNVVQEAETEEFQSIVGVDTYSRILEGFARSTNVLKVWDVYSTMQRQRFDFSIATFNAIIDVCGRAERVDLVHRIFEHMKRVKAKPDLTTYGTMLRVYCREGEVDMAFKVLEKMLSAMNSDSRSKDTTQLTDSDPRSRLQASVFNQMKESIFNQLIESCVNHKELKTGYAVFQEMENQGVPPSTYTVLLLIRLYADTESSNAAGPASGHDTDLDSIFTYQQKVCQKYGLSCDTLIYSGLIEACFKHENLSRALTVLDKMVDNGVHIDGEACMVLVRGCLKLNALRQAESLFRACLGLTGGRANFPVLERTRDIPSMGKCIETRPNDSRLNDLKLSDRSDTKGADVRQRPGDTDEQHRKFDPRLCNEILVKLCNEERLVTARRLVDDLRAIFRKEEDGKDSSGTTEGHSQGLRLFSDLPISAAISSKTLGWLEKRTSSSSSSSVNREHHRESRDLRDSNRNHGLSSSSASTNYGNSSEKKSSSTHNGANSAEKSFASKSSSSSKKPGRNVREDERNDQADRKNDDRKSERIQEDDAFRNAKEGEERRKKKRRWDDWEEEEWDDWNDDDWSTWKKKRRRKRGGRTYDEIERISKDKETSSKDRDNKETSLKDKDGKEVPLQDNSQEASSSTAAEDGKPKSTEETSVAKTNNEDDDGSFKEVKTRRGSSKEITSYRDAAAAPSRENGGGKVSGKDRRTSKEKESGETKDTYRRTKRGGRDRGGRCDRDRPARDEWKRVKDTSKTRGQPVSGAKTYVRREEVKCDEPKSECKLQCQ